MIEIHNDDCGECSIPFTHLKITTGRTVTHVCAHCRHWLNNPKPKCECPVSCHASARAGVMIDSDQGVIRPKPTGGKRHGTVSHPPAQGPGP